ncbi:MAG: hypothetical protein ABJA70_14935 [Chryseolinea sp.]
MPEKSLDLIEYLVIQQERFSVIKSHLAASGMKFEWRCSLRCTFMTYHIDLIASQGDGAEPLQFYRWNWNMDESQSADPEIHCLDKDLELLTRNHAHPVSYNTYRKVPVVLEQLFTEEVMDSVKIADDIAKQCYQSNSGDHYFPGYFSEILLSRHGIVLSQINKWNSRSIDHKNDYTMRALQFTIPYDEVQIQNLEFEEENIGRMRIKFSDLSSNNNRWCGDLIREKIKLQKLM